MAQGGGLPFVVCPSLLSPPLARLSPLSSLVACLAQPIPEVDNHLQRLINLGKRSMDHSTTRSYDKIHLYSKALVPMRSAQSLHDLLGCGSGITSQRGV